MLAFWTGILLVYAPAWRSGFVAEFLQMYFDIDRIPFTDFINRTHAEVKSFYQFTQLQLYVLIEIFGTHYLPWFLLFTLLHAVNGLLGFLFFGRLLEDFGVANGRVIAFAGIVLFLFNPNITEVTIWKAGYHYLTGLMMQLGILLYARSYLLHNVRRHAIYAFVLFLFSVFSLEIFYVTPALVLVMILSYRWMGITDAATSRRGWVALFAPQVVLFASHLLLFRLVYGGWIAHYGVTSDFHLAPAEMFPRMMKYLASILLMAGHFPEKTRFALFEWIAQPAVSYTVMILLLLATVAIAWRFRNMGPRWRAAGFLLAAILCCVVLVSPIYFDDLFSLYNSRRCYQLSLFLYMLVSVALFRGLRSDRLALGLFLFYFVIAGGFTIRKVFHWKTAAEVQYTLLQKMTHDNRPVLLLNLPSYYKDVRTYAAGNNNEFNRQLMLFTKDSVRNLHEVSSYNMQHTWDGAHVTVLDSASLKVTLNQWGTWWLYNYNGAKSYETNLYKVEMTDPGHEYILRLKKRPEEVLVFFQQGYKWKAVDFTHRNEQW